MVKFLCNGVFGRGLENAGDAGGMVFADGFAVPAGAFRVHCIEAFLVSL